MKSDKAVQRTERGIEAGTHVTAGQRRSRVIAVEESILAVSQRFAHSDLAFCTVVVPAVVEKVDTLIEAVRTMRMLSFQTWPCEMITANPYDGDHFSSVSQTAGWDWSSSRCNGLTVNLCPRY